MRRSCFNSALAALLAAGGVRAEGRGFPVAGPWVSFYGPASKAGDLKALAQRFRIFNIDADPDAGNFTPQQIDLLRGSGNRVLSYLNVGSCERFRSYWSRAAKGFVPCGQNAGAQLGAYEGYEDEEWMDPSNPDYQHLIVRYVAPRLVSQGVDGFYLDNLELLGHGTETRNGPCDGACVQGGLDLVRLLREAFPNKLIVMQNGTGVATRTGRTGKLGFPELLDGIAHEEVYAPQFDEGAEAELLAWKALGLRPGGFPFWIATEDYVGSCTKVQRAKQVYARAKARGFSPYASDASSKQQQICLWKF